MSSSCSLSSEDHESKEDDELNFDQPAVPFRPTREQILMLLRPLQPEQLIELLVPFIESDPAVYVRMVNEANSNVIFRKLFVHGLPLSTTELEFRNFFQAFGEIEAVELPIPRPFAEVKYGFIVYSRVDSVHRALVTPNKWFGGKEICCKVFTVRPAISDGIAPVPLPAQPQSQNKKIFVSGLPMDVNYNEFLAFFGRYGSIENAQIAPNKGSGFIVYTNSQAANDAIIQSKGAMWNGRRLTVTWYRKRSEDDVRVSRRLPMPSPSPASPWTGPAPFSQGVLANTVAPPPQWYGFPYYHPEQVFYVSVPMSHQDIQPGALNQTQQQKKE